MWKLVSIALVFGFYLHAENMGRPQERGGDEQQDSEPYAVTPGNPSQGDDPVTGAKNDQKACLSADTVKRFEKKSAKSIKRIKELGTVSKRRGFSLKNVRLALQAGNLLPTSVETLGEEAQGAGGALQQHRFVNLMDCKEWRDKIKSGAGELPLGAVLIFKGGRHGDARIKTPEGCLQGEAGNKDKRCTMPVLQLTGVYVQVAN